MIHSHLQTNLEETKLVWGISRTDDYSFNIADVDISAGNGERWSVDVSLRHYNMVMVKA